MGGVATEPVDDTEHPQEHELVDEEPNQVEQEGQVDSDLFIIENLAIPTCLFETFVHFYPLGYEHPAQVPEFVGEHSVS